MKLDIKKTSHNIELTDMDIQQIEQIYLRLWKEKATIGGAKIWAEAIVIYLISQGYNITK